MCTTIEHIELTVISKNMGAHLMATKLDKDIWGNMRSQNNHNQHQGAVACFSDDEENSHTNN